MIYDKLIVTFSNPTTKGISRAVEVMGLINPFIENSAAQNSYKLFHLAMQTSVSLVYSEEKKWEAARLAMHGAYRWDEDLPFVENPRDILVFLDHHFGLVTRKGENQEGPIQDALHALAHASRLDTIEPLEHFDPTEPSFIRGICHALQGDRPLHLRRATLSFLPLVGEKWFSTPNPIMEPDQMRRLCLDWASAIDDIEPTDGFQRAALTVLLE